ncbi:MAG: TolC family protein [Candidatus Cyclobacteriaceae bacterium M3_2C_046]
MDKVKVKLLLVLIFFLSGNFLWANPLDSLKIYREDVPSLSLDDCLVIGLEENLSLKNERIDVQQSRLRQKIFRTSLFFPEIKLNSRVSDVYRPGEEPRISQSLRAYTNFQIFNMANGPRGRKYENYVKLNEYRVDAETADLQRDIAVAYINANLVRKKLEILIDELLELDSLYDLSLDTTLVKQSAAAVSYLQNNISPLKERIQTQLKGFETNYDDKIGQLKNLMSLDNSEQFRLADTLVLTGNSIENEVAFLEKIIERTIEIRTTDDQIRKELIEEDMKLVNAAFFPEIGAGASYEQDFITNFEGFAVNIFLNYNVLDPNAKKKKDIARLDIEKINNSLLENTRDTERWIRSNYNKAKEYRSQVRPSLVKAQRDLYYNNLEEFLTGTSTAINATDVIDALQDFYRAQLDYFENIAYAEIHKMHIRFFLMDFVSPFSELGSDNQNFN